MDNADSDDDSVVEIVFDDISNTLALLHSKAWSGTPPGLSTEFSPVIISTYEYQYCRYLVPATDRRNFDGIKDQHVCVSVLHKRQISSVVRYNLKSHTLLV